MDKNIIYIVVAIFLLLPSVSIVSAYDNINIEIQIEPRGPSSLDYNVVGDAFTYKINLTNLGEKKLIKDFNVCINTPIELRCRNYTQIELLVNKSIELIPNQTNGLIEIIKFDSVGDYKINITSNDIIFIKNYTLNKGYSVQNLFNQYPLVYEKYFDCMPKWQYDLFEKEFNSAEESLKASKKSLEANEKLLELNIDLDKATKSMMWASWLMFIVAIITLAVALWDKHTVKNFLKVLFVSTIAVIVAILILIIVFAIN
ncbi:hypothetical protein KAT36_00305 [Candidatus Pacearchaeota archaeon]|nr:hypothetical protein [Candidatus Pacearchaeota archaeon]